MCTCPSEQPRGGRRNSCLIPAQAHRECEKRLGHGTFRSLEDRLEVLLRGNRAHNLVSHVARGKALRKAPWSKAILPRLRLGRVVAAAQGPAQRSRTLPLPGRPLGNSHAVVRLGGAAWASQEQPDAEDGPERRALPRELDDTRAAHVRTCMRPEHGHAACIRAARVDHGGRVLDIMEHCDAAVRRELRVVALNAAVRMITIDEAHVESRPTAPCPFGFA